VDFSKWSAKLKASPTALCFSSDNKVLGVGDVEGSIYIYDLQSGNLLQSLEKPKAIAPTSLFDQPYLPTNSLWYQNQRSTNAILAVCLHDQFLYSFDEEGIFTQWLYPSMEKLKECCIESHRKEETFSHALFKPSDNTLVVVYSECGLYMPSSWLYTIPIDQLPDFGRVDTQDLSTGRLPEADADTLVDSLALSKDGREFVVTSCTSAGTMDGDWAFGCPEFISVYGNPFFECCFDSYGSNPPTHEKNVAAFSPDGKQILVSANSDDCLYFLDRPPTASQYTQYIDQEQSRRLYPALGQVFSLDWAPTSDLIAAGNGDGDVAIWSADNLKLIWKEKLFTSAVEHLLFSSDGTSLGILSANGELIVMTIEPSNKGINR
jgi:WD40 repeat protein